MPSPELRASDADRQILVAALQRHYADGRLTSDALRERVGQALVARTHADLLALQGDLPFIVSNRPVTAAVRTPAPSLSECRQGFRAHALSYVLVIAILIVLWLLTSPGGYFWPIWPMAGWGIALASHGVAYRRSLASAAKVTAYSGTA